MRNWIFVKVETDRVRALRLGRSHPGMENQGVVGAIEDLSVLLIGQDPRRTEHLWQIMHRQYFWRGGITNYTAISGIDQALWDIKGKELGRPSASCWAVRSATRFVFTTILGGGYCRRDV